MSVVFINLLLLVFGFILLIKGADYLIEGSTSVAKKFNIPNIVIGLTLVAFGTSLPEMIVNVFASIKGSSDMQIGNIIGSNISNIFLILGVATFICPIKIKKGTVWKEIPLSILAVVLLAVMLNDALFDARIFNELSRIDGVVLLSFFVIFIYYIFGMGQVEGDDTEEMNIHSIKKTSILIVLGMFGLFLGGKWIVDSVQVLARMMNISEAFISLSIVAFGTSLPELATSIMAALRKNADMAIGNVVGSNIFNIFWVLGLSAVINPIKYDIAFNVDLIVVIFATVLLFVFMHINKRYHLNRFEGISFVSLYILYVGYLVLRMLVN